MTAEAGLYLHAVGILGPKGAILLMGHSGAGKTTLSNLVSDHFPILADDLVFACPNKNNDWVIIDGKRIGIKNKADRISFLKDSSLNDYVYPLHSLVRVFAAKETKIQSLLSLNTCEYLLNAVFELHVQSLEKNIFIRKKWFHSVADIARRCKGWKLRFSLDAKQAVAAMRRTI